MIFLRRLRQYLAATLGGLCILPIYATESSQALGDVKATAEKGSPAKNSENSLLEQYMKVQIKSQTEEKFSLEKQLKHIEITQREALPLIFGMLDSLDNFVQMDLI
jgi:Protein of unknown function (DUF3450)